MTEQIIGIAASVFTAIAVLPQLVKIIKEKKAQDVSLLMFCILIVGQVLWVIYGIQKTDWPIIISNSFSLLANSAFLTLHIIYGHRENQYTK